MEPLATAAAFATIVGLVGQFRGERSAAQQPNLEEFKEWLEKEQRNDINTLIDQQAKMTEGIKIILAEERDMFLDKLETINNALISYSSHINGFSQIAESINPSLTLSNQAISILKQFETSQASKALEHNNLSEMHLILIDGNGGAMEIEEQRFVEDDLNKLVEIGLLIHGYNSSGKNLYTYTRKASALVNNLNS